jgi:hypothetical protein
MIMHGEFKANYFEAAASYLKTLSGHSPGRTGKHHDRQPMAESRSVYCL